MLGSRSRRQIVETESRTVSITPHRGHCICSFHAHLETIQVQILTIESISHLNLLFSRFACITNSEMEQKRADQSGSTSNDSQPRRPSDTPKLRDSTTFGQLPVVDGIKICCIGAGYVGGPTMAMIASSGCSCLECQPRKRPRGHDFGVFDWLPL